MKLTASNKILLSLFVNQCNRQTDNNYYNVPYYATQRGIAECTGIILTNVPRNVKKLIKEGLITESVGYVKGLLRKRKVYFLTEKGKMLAEDLYKKLTTQQVMVFDKYGKGEQKSIIEVMNTFKVGACVILRALDTYGNIQLESILNKDEKKGNFVYFSHNLLPLAPFFGRKREIETIQRFIEREYKKVITIYGIAGIGKTSLIVKILENYKKNYNTFYYRFHQGTTLKSVLSLISEFLAAVGRKSLIRYLERHYPHLDEVAIILRKEFKELQAIIAFDDIHKVAKNEVRDLLRYLVEIIITEKSNTVVIFGSREKSGFYDKTIALSPNVGEIYLSGLERDASRKLLKKICTEEEFNKIYTFTQGHPLALKILNNASNAIVGEESIKEYIYNEVSQGLSVEEKDLLFFLSNCRDSVSTEMLFENGFSYDPLQNLFKRNIIYKNDLGCIEIYNIVKNSFVHKIPPQVQKAINTKLSEYYIKIQTPLSSIAAIHHYLKAKEYEKAIEIIIKRSNMILENNHAQQLLSMLEEVSNDLLPRTALIFITKLKGDAYYTIGNLERAFELYLEALNLCESQDNFKAEIFWKIGALYWKAGRYTHAFKIHNKALKYAKNCNDKKRIAYSYCYIGQLYFRKAKLKKAEKCLNKALKYCRQVDDTILEGRLYLILSHIISYSGRWKDSLKYALESLKIFESCGDFYGIATAYDNIGFLYALSGEHDKALTYYYRELDIAKQNCFIRLLGQAYCNIAFSYTDKINSTNKEINRGLELCAKALSIFEQLKDEILLARAYSTYGSVYARKRMWDDSAYYFKLAIKIANKVEDLPFVAQIYLDFAKMYVAKEDLKKAKIYLKKAHRSYKKLKNNERYINLKRNLKR